MSRVALEPAPAPETGSTLVVVSNRLPYDRTGSEGGAPVKRNVGGLVNAVEPVLAGLGGAWVGWNGSVLPNLAAVREAMASSHSYATPGGVRLLGVPLSEREVSRCYHGYCNRALWPLFHDFVEKAVFLPEDFNLFARVNRRFAESALAAAGPEGRIWVHDFHLLLVPRLLRELGFAGRIDFFMHIPFPPAEVFRVLPQREQILEGLLAADTVGFHTRRYQENFVKTAQDLASVRAWPARGDVLLAHDHGVTAVREAPIGVDVAAFEGLARRPDVQARARRIQAAHRGRPIVLSVDRLDYTKGIRERMAAIERLLVLHPGLAGAFELVQIVVPSRHQVEEYRQLKREIDREVGRINGEYGQETWAPIHYRYRALDREELVAHYLAASVALVTPLRDGMNLVALEYAVTRVDGDGVLIVSEFAGAAERLPEALVVNAYDVDDVARAIRDALKLPQAERRERMEQLHRRASSRTTADWADQCLSAKEAAAL